MTYSSRSRRQSLLTASDETRHTAEFAVRRHKPDYLIVLYMGLLMLLGLIIMYAIGPQRANVLNNAYGSDYGDLYFFIKQTTSLVFALAAFAVMALVSYKWINKYASKLLIVAFTACAVLAIAGWANLGIVQESFGAVRWFNLGPLGTLQPAELLKFALLIFTSGFLANKIRQNKLNDTRETLWPLGIITAVSLIFIVVFQKDLGTGVALMSIIGSMLFVGGINLRKAAMIGLVILVAAVGFIVSAPHRIDRVATYLRGDNTSIQDEGSYHIEHAKIAIGTGGLFGLGIGNSVQATGYLPEAINDSVFAILGETFGFVGLMVVLALFSVLLFRLLKLMDHLVDIRLKLVVAGIFGWLGSHVILNIASMTGILPLTGITLPLLSFGGTSMLFIAAALGLAFQLSRYSAHGSVLKEIRHEGISSRRGLGRPRYTSRSGF